MLDTKRRESDKVCKVPSNQGRPSFCTSPWNALSEIAWSLICIFQSKLGSKKAFPKIFLVVGRCRCYSKLRGSPFFMWWWLYKCDFNSRACWKFELFCTTILVVMHGNIILCCIWCVIHIRLFFVINKAVVMQVAPAKLPGFHLIQYSTGSDSCNWNVAEWIIR